MKLPASVREKLKAADGWCLSMQVLPIQRSRRKAKRPVWIIILVCLVSLFLICGYTFTLRSSSACYAFSSRGCRAFTDWIPPLTRRYLSDEEVMSQIVISEILNNPPRVSKTSKIAFMFLTPGSLPFERLWHLFLNGHEGKFNVYVHASREKPVHESSYFVNSDIPSDKVEWGQVSMVAAEKRLLAYALKDPDNQHFVLLSDSCVPLHDFGYIYNYLLYANVSFIESFIDPGPFGNGRYSAQMLPEIEEKHFRKGSQWFTMKRQHAVIVMADNLYFSKFRDHCRPGMEHDRNCYSDEHYLPTFFSMIDPGGISNWSVTHVDWSEHKWHPRSYVKKDISYELLQGLASIDHVEFLASNDWSETQRTPCLWNGVKRPCHLFARKFEIETLEPLMELFSNYTNT